MKQLLLTVVVLVLVVGCGGAGQETGEETQVAEQAAGIQLEVEAPEPTAVPTSSRGSSSTVIASAPP